MHAALRTWFDEVIPIRPSPQDPQQVPMRRIEFVARLIGINRNHLQVTNYGEYQQGGPYGRLGISWDEAVELIGWGGFFDAVDKIDPASWKETFEELKGLIRQAREEREGVRVPS